MARLLRRCCGVLTMVVLLAIASPACVALDTEIEEAIGRWMAEAFIAQRGRLDQPPITEWVDDLGRRLVEHSPRQRLSYHFIVLDSPESNGFALPGGWVFVTAGLLETIQSEDELAAVLSHELAHLAGRDFQQVALRNAVYLGIASLVRSSDASDWTPVVHAVQLVDGLRDSRRREARADRVGVEIAWSAGYDPRAMSSFLGDQPAWSFLEEVFATHPHPSKRREWIGERFRELRDEDPAGVNALAESLIERGRYREATGVLQEPLPQPHGDRRAELLECASSKPAETAPANHEHRLPADAIASLKGSLSAMEEERRGARDERSAAWRRLRGAWSDRQINRALLYAQSLDPPLDDPAYLALLAQTVHLMHRAIRGANLAGRILHMEASNANEMRSLAQTLAELRTDAASITLLETTAEQATALAAELGAESVEGTSRLRRLAGEYHDSGRLVAMLFSELAVYGNDPLNRPSFSRFMIMQTQVRMLDLRLERLDSSTEQIAATRWAEAVDLRRLQLNATGLRVTPEERARLMTRVAGRIGADEPGPLKRTGFPPGIGDATLQLIQGRVTRDDARFGADLRATQIMMRLSFVDTEEQVAWWRK